MVCKFNRQWFQEALKNEYASLEEMGESKEEYLESKIALWKSYLRKDEAEMADALEQLQDARRWVNEVKGKMAVTRMKIEELEKLLYIEQGKATICQPKNGPATRVSRQNGAQRAPRPAVSFESLAAIAQKMKPADIEALRARLAAL